MKDDHLNEDGGSGFGPIRIVKSYEALADHLREQILSGGMPEGSVLPNEREIGERTGLSRGSVREALRVLEVEGMISTRPGRYGGRTVRRPGGESVTRSLQLFIRGQQIAFDAVLETRDVLEPALASLAAVHRADADIAALAEASAELEAAHDDVPGFLAANLAWHSAVAQASHNQLLVAVFRSIEQVLHESTNVENFVSAEVRVAVIRAHQRVESAIIAGDSAAAYRRMERHVKAYWNQVKPLAPETITIDAAEERQ